MNSFRGVIIDQGNSQTKIAEFQNGHLLDLRRFDNDVEKLQKEISQANARIIFSSSASTDSLIIAAIADKDGLLLSSKTPLPFKIDYETPETLGLDRIANIAGFLVAHPKSNGLVIDAGTCITYDVIEEGTFVGGAISPGMSMRFKAMNNFTGRLPLTEFDGPTDWPAKDTISCLQTGVFEGVISEMDRAIEKSSVISNNFAAIITGGDSKHFARALKSSIFADPNLTLKGLYEILLYNGI